MQPGHSKQDIELNIDVEAIELQSKRRDSLEMIDLGSERTPRIPR